MIGSRVGRAAYPRDLIEVVNLGVWWGATAGAEAGPRMRTCAAVVAIGIAVHCGWSRGVIGVRWDQLVGKERG